MSARTDLWGQDSQFGRDLEVGAARDAFAAVESHHGLHSGAQALEGAHHVEKLNQIDRVLVLVMHQPQQIRFRDLTC